MLWSVKKNQDKSKMMLLRRSQHLVLIGLVLFIANGISAGTGGKIKGNIVDALDRKGMSGAKVVIIGTSWNTVTDTAGRFLIANVLPGWYSIQVSHNHYVTATDDHVRSIQGLTTLRDFKLYPEVNLNSDAETLAVEASTLKSTIITPHMEQDLLPGKNVIYCSAFQVAWNTLSDNIIDDVIHLEGDPEVAQNLNRRLATRGELAGENFVAMAGPMSEGFVQQIERGLSEKIGNSAPFVRWETNNFDKNEFIAFAYQSIEPRYACPFGLVPLLLPFHSSGGKDSIPANRIPFVSYFSGQGKRRLNVGVVMYGIPHNYKGEWSETIKKGIRVKQYKHWGHFIVELKGRSDKDTYIFAQIDPQKTLLETYRAVDSVVERGNPNDSALKENDILWMPILKFNIRHSYAELEGKALKNKKWEKWKIAQADQWVRFNLITNKNLLNRVDTLIGIWSPPEITRRQDDSRDYFFNSPFLLYFKKKGYRYPYFAMWVANSELMVKPYEQ